MAVFVHGCSVVPPPLNGVPGDTVVSGGVAVVVVAGSLLFLGHGKACSQLSLSPVVLMMLW